MIPIHVTLKENTVQKINNYKKDKKLSYSKSIEKMIDIATDNLYLIELIEKIEKQINNIYIKEHLLEDLIKQLYSDLEIVNLTNPKNNEALNKFFDLRKHGNDD